MNLNACEGCLSVNRSLKIVNENERKLFYTFINTNYSKDQLELCWECRALLKKFLRFKLQVRKARDVLDSYVAHHTILNSLSSLRTTQCEHEIVSSEECSQETPSLPSVKIEVDKDVQDFTAEKLFDNDGVDKEALINALRAEMDTIESELTDDKSDINGATSAVSETDTTFEQNQHINPSHSLHAKMDTIENETIENEKTEDIFGCSDEDPLHVTKVEKRIQIKRRISSYETTDDSDDESDINGPTLAVSETDTTFKQNRHTTECKNEVACSIQCKERENPSLISVKIEDDKDVVEDFSAANTINDDDMGLMTNASHSLNAEMDTIENETIRNEKTEDIFGCSDEDPLHVTKVEKRIHIRRRISSNETTDDSDDESDINGATSAVSETDTTFEQNQHTNASNSLHAEMDTIENERIENEKAEDIFGCSDDDPLLVVKVQKRIQISRRISSNETTDDSDDESDINGATSAVGETDTTFEQNQQIIASNSLNTEIDLNMDTSENETIGNENDTEDLFDCSDDDPLNIKEKKRTSKIKRRASSNEIEDILKLYKPQNGYHENSTGSNSTSSGNEHTPKCRIIEDINVTSTKQVGFSTPKTDKTSIDIQKLHVPSTTTAVKKTKRHFCPFCKKLQTKFSRHLILKHADEDDVKKFLSLSKRSIERKEIIASIRKRGDFLHNTLPEFNTGILIVPRQRKSGSVNSAEDYIPCKNCKLFLSKTSIRFHIPLCDKSHRKGSRTALRDGRRLAGYIHPCASETLRRTIFPAFQDDAIIRCIKYDEIIIKFGNKLCEQYTLSHQHDHIRAQLRLLGRLKVEMMILDGTIHELMSVFDPKQFDNLIKSIKIIASWNEKLMRYDHPSVAQNLTTLIKKCAKKLKVECIKSEDNNRKSLVENFLLLWEEKVSTTINNKALEDLIAQKLQKKAILPSKSDIKLLYDYLHAQCFICLKILTDEFQNSTWVLLIQTTLILVQIFNRRRAGEIERLTLIDYENKSSLNENVDPEIYNKLSENTREYAAQYKRLTIRGERGRMVPVLLSPIVVNCIDLILKYRKEAKIASSNEYIFSKPSGSKLSKPYFRACPLMRRFANDCGTPLPGALRGTTLRKHISTYIAMLDIEVSQVDRLANFMGNNKDSYKNIHRMPVPVAEITKVSRLLMSAIGDDDEEDNEASDEENSDSSDEDVNDGNDDPELDTHENTNKKKASHTLSSENGETYQRKKTENAETTDDSDDESDINGATSAVSETDTTFEQNQHTNASHSRHAEIDTIENETIENDNNTEDLSDCSDDEPLNIIKEKKSTSKTKRRLSSNAIERIPQLSKPQNGYQEHNTRSDLTSSDINVSSTKYVGFSTPNPFDNTPSIDIQQLHVPSATTKLEDPAVNKSKSHFCPFCKKLQTKFSRHLLLKHADKDDVKKFLHLSKRSKKRKKIIASIRKRGDFLHNTSPEFNTGILIVPRQRKSGSVNSAEDYIPCKNCKLFLSKTSLRLHIPLCDKSHRKGSRTALRDGRRLAGYIHPCASETLRRTIFPVFKDDAIVRCIKYDEIIIKFGNKLCEKYTLTHQHDHIRAQLRLLGRLKVEMMILDETIYELMSVFDPKQFDNIIKSIKIIASWNEQIMWYDLPSVAQNLITLIKKCAKKLRVECIKSEDNNRKSIVENFLLLWKEKVPNIYTIINKKVLEDQVAQKRQKKAILPSKSDIKLLYDYLQEQCFICLEILTNEFQNSTWVLLIQSTLILVQIHNRRRPGEIERLTLIDYENKTSLNENVVPEIYNKLSEKTRKYAAQYKRLTIRGERGRIVPVLLSPVAVICIDLIIKYRKEAKIASSNEYIFSKPNGSKLSKPYFRACPLMRRFANDCGALIPSALRGTTLKKHIATYIEMLNIEESHVDRLANVMGNNKDIHKNIYIMPVPVAEITDVSRLLMSAIGDDQEGNKASDEENSDSSDEDVNDGNDDPELNTHENTNKRKASHTLTFENGETCKRKKTEVADPHNGKTRQKWSDREREAVARYFGDILVLSKLPSLQECQTCINMNSKILHHRSAPQLKTWIDNQRRAKDRKEAYASNKKAKQL